ncbi:ATP-binding protein [Niveibacterium sp. SC-1]|uniref:HAMP domain-containing sensor histidine kinase n=1 Tax=Niveibacterium sp. SC-1 TaxID=3135646 RepID=UPI00311DB338
MGRLFWRIFAGFLVGFALLAVGVGVGSRLYFDAHAPQGPLMRGPRADMEVTWIAELIRHGDRDLLAAIAPAWRERRPLPLIVDPQGRDILQRPVPPEALAQARADQDVEGSGVQRVRTREGEDLLVFVPRGERRPPLVARWNGRGPGDPVPVLFAVAAVLASLAISALLARNLSGRIRRLRDAFESLASGALDTRVASQMPGHDEIAQLGTDFDRMAQRLEGLVGAQRRLLYDVSHELRSPLARLQVAIGLARQQPERTLQALERIELESTRLDTLIGELLTLSRLESGNPLPTEDHLDLIELLHTVADDARFEATASKKRVLLEGDLDRELVVRGHGELLHRALDNVLRNALRHSPPGADVLAGLHCESDGMVRICIADRGPGVAEGDVERMFEAFVHGEGSSGYGLGLAIARRAVEAHGGNISATNRAGGGLEVCMRMPLRREAVSV